MWRKGFFAFEYKGKHKDLTAAYSQLLLYREDLQNPPLLVVTDTDRFEVHTNFTGTVKKVHAFTNVELPREENLRVLRALFTDPDSLLPEDHTEHHGGGGRQVSPSSRTAPHVLTLPNLTAPLVRNEAGPGLIHHASFRTTHDVLKFPGGC